MTFNQTALSPYLLSGCPRGRSGNGERQRRGNEVGCYECVDHSCCFSEKLSVSFFSGNILNAESFAAKNVVRPVPDYIFPQWHNVGYRWFGRHVVSLYVNSIDMNQNERRAARFNGNSVRPRSGQYTARVPISTTV
jgi:hypothetical protein